jgi:8-oxo-dGTP pyrophosphatase MutT (NUDIX family)
MKIDQTWYARPDKIGLRTSAGGIIARIEDGKAYIALVKEQPFGIYVLPKGGVEPGEDRLAAAQREIEEEAGLSDLLLIEYLGTRERLTYDKRKWVTTHYYLFLTDQKEGKPTDLQHAYTCEWFPIDELPEMLWPEQQALLESCREKIEKLVKKEKHEEVKAQGSFPGDPAEMVSDN